MARTVIQDVKDIYSDSGGTDAEIYAAIDIAHVLIEDRLVGRTGASETLLAKIETLLAAHFLVINVERGGIASEKIGDAVETMTFKAGSGMSATRYGQQAMLLDPTGVLAAIGRKRASMAMYPVNISGA